MGRKWDGTGGPERKLDKIEVGGDKCIGWMREWAKGTEKNWPIGKWDVRCELISLQ